MTEEDGIRLFYSLDEIVVFKVTNFTNQINKEK